MRNEISLNEYLSKLWADFDDSTLISPNKNGEKQKGKIDKSEHEFEKENLVEFVKSNSISINDLFLAGLSLTLNKFNFSNETLIFNQNNVPFATKFENREISIKEFLQKIHENYNLTLGFDEFVNEENLLLKPEFYYTFDDNLKSDLQYSNYLSIVENNKTVSLFLFYNSELYTKDFIDLFLSSLEKIMNEIIDADLDKTNISDIALVCENEDIAFSEVEMPLIHKRFEKQANDKPDEIALVARDATLTYRELDQKANVIANSLIDKGVNPKSNVLIMLSRDSNLIASILGILKAGCAFIPIDPEYPQDRINYIYENSQADYIISNESRENFIDIDELVSGGNAENPNVDVEADDLAYMIYTSGSTGNPKGVMISHINACNQTAANPKCEYNNLLSIATIAFDTSLEDILTGLTNGIEIIFADDVQIKNIVELIKLIKEYEPEVMEFTPSRLLSYLEVDEFCKAISCAKCIVMGGEQFSAKAFNLVKKYCDAVVYNSYGPTEATIASNYKEITDADEITIGKALENYVTEVRDIDGKLLPQGVMGELYIGGIGVGKGYYNMGEKTKEVFLTINDIPYYRSGDYAIELPNGELVVKGRIDNQIKLRGLRIEIGEIESNIGQYPDIKQVAVVIKEINNNDHLCAYYTADSDIDSDDLKEYLKDRLTRYMVPTVFMQLDEMPQTPNGKTDLKKLPEPQLKLSLTLPETDTEERLMDIVSSLTETKEFGTTDDLYAIGFTSLTLMKLNAIIYDEMGVNLDIITLLNDPTIKNIAYEIENNVILDLNSVIELSHDMEYYPLTENQMGIYYECIQSDDVPQYNIPSIIRFGSEIDTNKLKEAIIKTIDSYPFLKTRIVSQKGKVMLKRNDSIDIDEIPIVNVNSISDEQIENENLKVFDLHNDQLFRFKIYTTPDETILFSDVHHIISDGESLDNLFTNIANAYQGIKIEEETVDGYINSLIENENGKSEKYELSKKFFHDKLTQEVDSTILTPNLNGNQEEGVLKSISKDIDPEMVNKFCSENKISPNVLFMAITMLNLNKYTFTDKTLITTIFNGRSNSSFINTQALLVKTLPIVSINEDRTLTIKEYLKSVNNIWMESINHCDYPYTKISEEFHLKPEFFYAFNNLDAEEIKINDKIYKVNYLDSLEVNYKISLDVNETKDNLELLIQYNDQLYSPDYIETFLNSIINVINQLIEEDIDKLRISEIELGESKNAPSFTPVDTPILHKRFEKQAIKNPKDIALVAGDATLTYRELDQKANIIANSLIDKGVKPKSNVLIMLSRDSNLIASILGILKAGCAFIPIDPEYPQDRINYIYENSQSDYIISNESGENFLDIDELVSGSNTENPDIDVEADDLAYMIYTSGSTGNPKGVMISHINACNQTAANPKCEYNNLLSIATIAFDTSLEDILTGLTNGIEIIFADDVQIKNIIELIKLIKEYEPEVMEFTPSRLLSYLEVDEFCKAISCAKCIVMGGEQFSAKAFDLVKKYCNAIVYNSYGPTEATIASNYKEITDANEITIGKALENYVTEVRDIDGKLLPQGVMGELYIGGIGVGKGYYNMPEKTKEVFLTINNIPYYRSGDYAIELPNGEIDIKGRIDNQIKLRGLRIEIGEIETNIGQYPDIKQVTVVIKEINGHDHLCAYYTAEGEIDSDDLKEYLKDRLTRYMVPTVFMQLDEMPQTPNGKTDLKQLPEPQLKLSLVMPENETEEKLHEIVSSLVSIEEFGVTDDLYAIGFTSLTLMKLNSIIYEQMGGNLDIAVLFNEPTIKNIAIELNNTHENENDLEEFIKSAKDLDYYPLTENQLGVYYECVQSPDVIKYTMPTTVRFGSDVDAVKLKNAIIGAIEAHPYLKTRIVTHDGELKQKRCDDLPIDDIEIVKVDSISEEDLVKNDIGPISLDGDQLFRFKIYVTPEEVVLFSDFHHIITDGASQINLFDDIANIYENRDIDEEIVDGFIYSMLEKEMENSEKYQQAEEFFDDKLTQEIDSTILTPNLSGDPDLGKIKEMTYTIDSKLINEFCNDNSISKNNLFMASAILCLNKFTFTDKTLITTIFNGRSSPNYFNTQAFLVKTIPLIIDNENRQESLRDFINSVNQSWKGALNNSIYPYIKLAEKYQLKPEFFYAYHEFLKSDDMMINGKVYEPHEIYGGDLVTSDAKINLNIYDEGDEFNLSIEYNDQLYTEDYVEKFLKSIKVILDQLIENDWDVCKIQDIGIESESQTTEFGDAGDLIIHERFEKQVDETPDNVALIASDETLSYRQLDQKANRIANALIKKGVKPKSRILIMLPRDSNLISSIFGVLKTGGAYIPIDLAYPQDRVDYIYENSEADYIIASETQGNAIGINDLLKEENTERPGIPVSPDDLVYMIYTSGSTGKPKGVMIAHENVAELFAQTYENKFYENFSKIKKSLSITSVSFDPFMMDMFPLTLGAKMVLADDDAVKDIKELTLLISRENPDTISSATPSRISQYMEYSGFRNELKNFKQIFLGGEMMSSEFVSKIKSYCDVSIYNCYGPTETTILCSFTEVTDTENITIGKASYNYLMDVRDIDGKLVPNGVIGELYIGGPGVGKGYYNLDDKTKEVFLTINDIPYYRSGDYAIELDNGEFVIKGRIDNQIKLRGLRIEIGEIESNITRYPNIKQCVVIIKEINNNDHLCAYFTAEEEIDVDDLKEFLNHYITQYMIPTVFMQIDEMPISPNGKTDIKQLPEPELKLALVMPVTDMEEKLHNIISDMVNIEEFGVTDDLYALGFTSLALIKLNSLIYEEFGVSLDISILFNNPTIRNFTHELENENQELNIDELIKSARNMEYYPLTENQMGIYYECAQSPDEIKYTMPMVTRFGSDVDAKKLKQSLIKVIDAHPYLKTRMVFDDEGELKQKRCDDEPIEDIPIVEVDEISDAQLIENDVMPFILNNNQLFRFKIYETPSETVLFSDYHHLITDGSSQMILFTDIANAYEGRPLSEEKVDSFIYSLIEKNLEESEKYQLAEEYFDDKLTQGIESTVLTPNLNGNVDDGKIKEASLSIDLNVVNEFCNKYSISKNTLFMAMAVLDLNKYTFSDKTLFTTIFNGRSSPIYYNTQGMLVKTLPIVLNNENRDSSIRQFIDYIDQTWKDSLNSSIYPYTKIAAKYQLKPEFLYSYQEFSESGDILINGRNYEPESLDDEDVLSTEYKIDLSVTESDESVELLIEYNDALYSEDYIQKFLDSMNNILNQFINHDIDEFRICDVELESQEVLPEFSEIELPFIHKRFEKQANDKPDEIALVARDATLTYRELDQKANVIANALIKKGVNPKSNILIMLPRDSNLIASILGILKAGCAFIPVDLEYPQERIKYIYENSQADYIISNESKENFLDIDELVSGGNAENPDVDVEADDLAYMIYTSGSTGNPKGVMISHINACNQTAANPKCEYNNLLSIATIAFDTSLEDILTGLTNGIEIIFADDVQIKNIVELIKLIKEYEPEVMEFTPSRLLSYLEVDEFCKAIGCAKCIVMGGEQFSAKAFNLVKKYCDAVVYNSYGPTEATIASNYKEITDVNEITIGKALENYVTEVRDIDGKLLPQGVMGELYIGGIGVGKGYYNMPEKTEEVYTSINDIPYYRSGDYAIELPNGELVVKGRIDNQIKLRGLRIEIGEIESNIGQYPNIKQNITVIKEINDYDHLCAYFTADEEIDTDDLKEYLTGRLTRYMVPTVFMQIDEMPQTPNGKIDLKQLPEPILILENVKPENETEERLFEMVSEFTNATEFGTTDDLYAIGLTSLTLMKLNTLIYKEMGVNLDISTLFNNPTIKNLAKEIKTNDNQDSYLQELIELSEEIEYYPLTENQMGVYYECIQNPDEIIYIIPDLAKFDSSVDADKLKQAVIDTIEAHPYLKTRIITTDDGEIKQRRNDDIAIDDIEIVEVDSIDIDEINKNDIKAIPLDNNQLFAFKIYKTPDQTVLLSVFHHIISDGVSHDNFFNDLISIYEGREIEEEVVNGYVYSLIERDIANSEKYELSKEFFHEKLSNGMESTVLTPNLNGNPDDGSLKSIKAILDSDKVTEFSKNNSISKNVLVIASTILALNKFTFNDKTLITTIFNGRANPNYYNTQAFLVKTLPFITNNENRQITVAEFLKSVNETWKDTINHIEYPYTKIAEEFQLKPEFFYTYEESFTEDDDGGIAYETEEVGGDDAIVTDYKINFNVSDKGKEIALNLEYNDQLYTEEYAQKFLDSVIYVLNQFMEGDNDNLRICDIALCDEIVSAEFSEVELPFIHKRFEKQVGETPNNVALIAGDATLTYNELNQKANRIANALIKMGVEPKSNVLVMLPRQISLICAIMGILKAGCAYVPIDMEYPKERIEYIYKNSEANYIITQGNIGDSLNVNDLLKENDISNPQVDISPDDLAYMIYTSGSTGNPKGVMISHKNITNLFAKSDDNIIYNAYSKMKKALAITTISFDTFLLDFMSLTFGLEVVLADDSEVKNIEELTELIHRQKPDALTFTTPSRIRQYLEYDKFAEELSTFSYIAVGGEILPKDVVSKILDNADTDIFNIYGPTETTVTCNSINITSPDNITVGKALHNYITDVRDIDGKLLPKGVMGELYIGGVGVSRGYHNLDDKTKEVFTTINDIPYYKSGDYAIELPNGEIDVKGRIDNQIKLRGLRIEIGEIEANIAKFPHIRQNVVVIKEINNNEHLCAYLTAEDKIDINLLRRYLKNKLTKYMIPTVFMQIDEMPQTPNGKTDIKRLPDPALNLNYVEAESETEEKLVKLVESIANTKEFGTTDDLHTLGFSSLTLMKLNSLIYQEMGVNLDITSLFSDPTIKNLADSIDNHIETVDVNEVIDLAKDMDYFPLTANQLGIYYECMQSPNEVKYTMPTCIRFGSNIDPEKLKQAIFTAIESHSYLKTRIINTDDGELKQKRCDDIAIDEIEIVEVDEVSNEDLMKENVRAFNLTKDQLFRFKIYKTPDETVLFSDFHHIITDGVSQDNIFTDIAKAYNGESIEKEKIDGFAYSLIEEANGDNEVSKKYFKNKLTQGIESTVLTPDLNGNPDIGKIKLVEENVNSTFVKHFCNDHAISPNVLFMATTVLALNKFTFSDKSLITTIFNGRANSDYFNTQGMLVKTIPIIINAENRKMMVEDFIKIVDKAWTESMIHSSYPYTKLAEEYQLKPEFFYAFHEFFQSEEFTIDGEDYTMEALDGTIATDYKINLNIFDDGEEINLVLEYNDQLYSHDYAKKFLQAMKFILVQFFVNDMDKYRLCDVKLKEDFGLHEFSEVELPFVHKRFEKQAGETPNNVALIAGDATLTYNELNQKANRIANALIKMGVEPKSNVLVMLPRQSGLICAIMGILKAGCAYVPIDMEYPKERIEYIYKNSEANYIITQGDIGDSLNVNDLLKENDISNPHVDISPDDLAYMIYTSGSTGNPKGVMISHKNITNLFAESDDNIIYNAYSKMKKALAITTISFDTFLLDFMSLTFGLELVLADDSEVKNIEELTELIRRQKPDALTFTTPSRIRQYLEYDKFAEELSTFSYIAVGGEILPQDVVSKILDNADTDIFNIYGPTETTVTCNSINITNPDNITVGKALHNYITDVRDIDGKLLPKGIIGELYIGGVGVSRGYHNLDEKTREVFTTINDIPYYKSGDYAIELPNGEIDIKGRIDNQIKLRGLRIEIGEIEANIAKFPHIRQNVVVIKEINNNEHLCAYFTANEKIDTDDLKEYLKNRLTRYMVPTVFMQIDEMPMTPNGKTDINQLPEPKLKLEYVAPENELEQLICAVFSSTLGIETVGAEDNFFEIGGTSLVASKIILELLKRDYTVKYDDVFTNQTPRQLARFLSGEHEVRDDDYDIADDYDYSQINTLLSENTLENFYNGAKQEIGNLLLTGVTGYLGIHVLYDYIKNEKGTVYCMLRKGGFDSCEDRLADLFDYYFDGELTDLIGSRIILSEGDITELDDFKKLEEYPIDTLINCAAIVKHYTADDYIFKVNVDGVINGIKYAQANNVRYIQISTVSVLSYPEDTELARDVQLDERTLYYRQDLTNKYVNSKFLAERMLLEAAVDGLDVKIVRVGNLMGRYRDGLFQKNYDTNAFLANIKSIKNIQAISTSMYNEAEEMSPIDCTAKAIIALSKTPQKCRVFNCQNKNELLNSDIINVLNSFGYDIREVSDDEFMEICRENMDENIQGLITSDMSMADEEADEEDDYEYILKTDQTVEILESLGFEWVKPDTDYLTRVIDYLNNLGFFN